MSMYAKELVAVYMAFREFAHIPWEATKPKIVLTDNKSVTHFFQTKAMPPALQNACDYVLHFDFKIAHIVGSVNTDANFLLEWNSKSWKKYVSKSEKICKQHLSRWPKFRQISLMKNNFSLQKQTITTSHSNEPLNGENNPDNVKQGGCIRGAILLENKGDRTHKDRRKDYVVFHEWNKRKCTNTSRARQRSSFEEYEVEFLGQPHYKVLKITD